MGKSARNMIMISILCIYSRLRGLGAKDSACEFLQYEKVHKKIKKKKKIEKCGEKTLHFTIRGNDV